MIIVSDTSPINYLVLIGEIEVLQKLAGQVIIPQAVYRELQDPHTPQQVKDWLDRLSHTSFYMPPDEIIQAALKRDQERKNQG